MVETATVAIVEDDFLIAEDLREMCEEFGAQVLDVLHEAEGAAERILSLRPGFVLMDVRLGPGKDGVDVARDVRAGAPATRVIFITGSNEPRTISRIESSCPHALLIKPIAPGDLRRALTP